MPAESLESKVNKARSAQDALWEMAYEAAVERRCSHPGHLAGIAIVELSSQKPIGSEISDVIQRCAACGTTCTVARPPSSTDPNETEPMS